MLEIKSFTFGLFETNTYVLIDDAKRTVIVDPACVSAYEQQQLFAFLKPFTVTAIIATHGHLDHLWGAKWVCEQYGLPVLMHEADMPLAEGMQQQYDLFGIQKTAEPFPIGNIQSAIGRQPSFFCPFSVLHTPGHTQGSVCLYWEQEKVLLSGDTLFRLGFGRTDLPGGNYMQLIESLRRLFGFPAEVRVYPGHGEFTTIGAECR